MSQPIYRRMVLFLCVWLAVWTWLSWPSMQDDALIHLRYADHLLHQHKVSFDGIHATFGASSLLYISLLAGLRTVFVSPLLPRAVSSVSHWLLFVLLAWGLDRVVRRRSAASWLAVSLLLCCTMPSATRWLQDGMETSLSLCFLALWAYWIWSSVNADEVRPAAMAGMVLFGVLTLLLRIELLMFLGVCSVLLFFGRRERLGPREPFVRTLVSSLGPLLGGLVGACVVRLMMGTLLPDTAVSKANGIHFWRESLISSGNVIGSALSFGIGMLMLWLISVWMLAVAGQWRRVSLLAANCLFPVTLVLVAFRGQDVQGFRYFAWTLLFPLVWNILTLGDVANETSLSFPSTVVMALCALIVLGQTKESPAFLRMFRQREAAIHKLRSHHLATLRGMSITAYDIGWIGYFAQADICDVGGLVGGRAWAKVPEPERAARCMTQAPTVLFVNEGYQIYWLRDGLPGYTPPDPTYVNWKICGEYNMANLTRSDWHYLVAPPQLAAKVCAATGQQPRPVTELLPPVGGVILHRSE